MSKVDLNALVNGFSGKLGNAVLRRRGNSTTIGSRPKKRESEPKPSEIALRLRFKRAAAYAKAKIKDPIAKGEYAQYAKSREYMNAFSAAVTDYLRLPKIESLKIDNYTGAVGDPITVGVADDFKIIAVDVTITLPNGTVLESGPAVFDATKLEWRYLATQANAQMAGTKVKATASDRPGNVVTLEV